MKFHLILVLLCCTFKTDIVRGLYYPCFSNSDCPTTDSVCSTQSANCQCENFEYVFSTDYTSCLKSSSIGEECLEDVQCNLMPTGASCNSGICTCTNDQKYLQGQCRVVNSLDESCNTVLDCDFGYDRESVQCKNNICDCANGYYRRNGNICRKRSMEINDVCVVDEDCEDLGEDAECKNLKCAKKTQEINSNSNAAAVYSMVSETSSTSTFSKKQNAPFSANDDSKLSETDESLKVNTQYSREIAIQTSIELLPLHTRLNDPPAAANKTNLLFNRPYNRYNSYLKSVRLADGANLIDEETGNKFQYGDSCSTNGIACTDLAHSICANNICLCEKGYYGKNGICYAELGEIAASANECAAIRFNLSCTANNQCSPFGPATCSPQIPRRCTCAQYAEYDEMRQLCVYKSGLGALCENNNGCVVPNSVCSNTTCVCGPNYYALDNACVPGLGATCASNKECTTKNSECQSTETYNNNDDGKTCQCRKGYVHFRENECFKEAEQLDDPCTENDQCAPLLAKCIDKKCSCADNQHFKNGRCQVKKELGEACKTAGECFIQKDAELVECRNSVCKCKLGFRQDASKNICVRTGSSVKSSSSRPSFLKIVTFALIGSAFLITTAALKQAYY